MPYLTSLCTACKRIRSDEPFLSHVARDPDLRVRMCMKVSTQPHTVSVRLCVVVGDSVRLRDAVCQHCRQSDPVEDQREIFSNTIVLFCRIREIFSNTKDQ